MTQSDPTQNTQSKAIAEIQNRLPDQVLAAGYFVQEIPTGILGMVIMGIGAIVGVILMLFIMGVMGLNDQEGLSRWFMIGLGGVAGAGLAQIIYNQVKTTLNRIKGQLPHKLFLAVSQDKVEVFRWQMGMSKSTIKENVASWPRGSMRVERSVSKEAGENSNRPALVFHLPNTAHPLVLLYSTGTDEKQVAALLTGVAETPSVVATPAKKAPHDPDADQHARANMPQFYRTTANAWASGKLKPFKPVFSAKMKNIKAETLYELFTTEDTWKPTQGSALQFLLANSALLADEFLVTLVPSFVQTNYRLVMENGDPATFTEIILADVASCDLKDANEGVLRFVMKTGEAITLLNCSHYPEDLDQSIANGIFTKA